MVNEYIRKTFNSCFTIVFVLTYCYHNGNLMDTITDSIYVTAFVYGPYFYILVRIEDYISSPKSYRAEPKYGSATYKLFTYFNSPGRGSFIYSLQN